MIEPEMQSFGQVFRRYSPPAWVWGLIVAALLLAVRVNVVLAERFEEKSWSAILIRQGSEFSLVSPDYGGLRSASEIIAKVWVKTTRGEAVAGASSLFDMVRDKAEFTVSADDTAKLTEASRAVLSDPVRLRQTIGAGANASSEALGLGDMIASGTKERTRVSSGGVAALSWAGAIAGCLVLSGLMWLVPWARRKRRASAISKGCCPGCGLPMGTLKSRTCPSCKAELAPEEFNAVMKHWRR